jgi:hypothetical protein
VQLETGNAKRLLTLSRESYREQELEIVPDRDQRLVLALERLATPRHGAGPRAGKKPASGKAPAGSASGQRPAGAEKTPDPSNDLINPFK